MKRNIVRADHPYRHLLVEYDPDNVDPCFPPDVIRYIESRQAGLTPRDIAKLDEIEWFVFHRQLKTFTSFAVPGLRELKLLEVRYFKRYNKNKYRKMINDFVAYVPPDFPSDQVDRRLLVACRLTSPDGSQFYPIQYNGDFVAWRKRMMDNAAHFGTMIGYFDHGRFVVSDGQEIEFADMDVLALEGKHIPPDF